MPQEIVDITHCFGSFAAYCWHKFRFQALEDTCNRRFVPIHFPTIRALVHNYAIHQSHFPQDEGDYSAARRIGEINSQALRLIKEHRLQNL